MFRDRRTRIPEPRTVYDRRCLAPGCSRSTTEHKPYCLRHIDASPYVASVKRELTAREGTDSASRVQEIVDLVAERGVITPKRLAMDVCAPPRLLERYLESLEREGRVRVMKIPSIRGKYLRVVAAVRAS